MDWRTFLPRLASSFLVLVWACHGGSDHNDWRQVAPRKGDRSLRGGTPTVRKTYVPSRDSLFTTNDESNDQPIGHLGTVTVDVHSHSSGNTYTLDADVDGGTVTRLYFPKGGWIDFSDCEVNHDLQGTCVDEEGRDWGFEGEASGYLDPFVDEEDTEGDLENDSDSDLDDE